MKRTYNFFQGNFFPQNVLLDTRNAVSTTPPKKIQRKANNVRFLWEYLKTQIFCTKKLFHQRYLVDTYKEILTTSLKEFVKRPKLSLHWPKRWKKSSFSIFFSPKVFYRHLAFSLDNPLKKKLPEGPQKNHQSHKTMKKILNFLKKTLVLKNFVDTYFAVLTTALEKFQQKSHKFWHRVQTW